MEILFHNESFPESVENEEIYGFANSLTELYYLYERLVKLISQEQCFVSTCTCKDNGNSVLYYLFSNQKRIKESSNIDIIRSVRQRIIQNIKVLTDEEFYHKLNNDDAIITNGYKDEFKEDFITVNSKILKNISTTEQFEKNKFYLPIRIYQSNPKHDIRTSGSLKGNTVSVMDLDNRSAQLVLNGAVQEGKKLYGIYGGKYYEFQCHKDNCWHGYCPNDGIPENIQRQLRESEISGE